jgi:hypothetical protein
MNIDINTIEKIWFAENQIQRARELRDEVLKIIKHNKENPTEPETIKDVFGKARESLELGVPSGAGSRRLLRVDWHLAEPIIDAHISKMKHEICVLNQQAKIELLGEYAQKKLSTKINPLDVFRLFCEYYPDQVSEYLVDEDIDRRNFIYSISNGHRSMDEFIKTFKTKFGKSVIGGFLIKHEVEYEND